MGTGLAATSGFAPSSWASSSCAIGFVVGRIGQVSGETEKVHAPDLPANPPASPVNCHPAGNVNPVYTSSTTRNA